MKTKIIIYKEKILTSLIIVICLSLYALFPAKDNFQRIFSSLTFLAVVPALYIKLVLKKNLKNYGLSLGDWRRGLIWSSIFFLFAFLIFYALIQQTGFAKNYFVPAYAYRFGFFILHEIFIVGFFVVLYEFFFRGFVQFSFISKIGYASIVLQTFVFIAFLAITNNLNWSFLPFVITAPFSGLIVFHSYSLFYSSAANIILFTLLDAYLIHLNR